VCCPKRLGGLNIKGCINWNKASVGHLLWQIIVNKEALWVKWVHGIYMKTDSIWNHKPPIDSSWYWRKINALKEEMQSWYNQGRYMLTLNGTYSISKSYLAIIGYKPTWKLAALVWTSMALPKHRFLMWLAVQGRLLTQERKLRLQIQVDDTECCLCAEKVMETNDHLFEKCKWISTVWQAMNHWTEVSMHNIGIMKVLECIDGKHWKLIQKEIMAAICGAIIYHTWRARNWRRYKGKCVQTDEAIAQIKKEIRERLQLLSSSKKAIKCRNFIQHLMCF